MASKKEADLCRIEWCDKPVVRVLGTVMTRDDNLGGWLPYMNGGQSKVGIHKSVDGRRYRIYGWRVNDKEVTLDCFIQRNMVFHETIGTFHHWKIGEKKMGLTFYTPAEARAFNRGVRVALEQLTKVGEYTSSSASSTCSPISDGHQSSCTSPASSTGSSSPCEISHNFRQKLLHEHKKKLSTSSTSSSSSRHGTRRRQSGLKPGRSHRVAHNSTSSNTSTQNPAGIGSHSNAVAPVTAALTLSLLSATTSPRFCDTPSSSDLGQQQFRWPLPQQQTYSTNLTFLNRPITKDGSPYELSALALPSPHSASSTICRETDTTNLPKPHVLRNPTEEYEQEEEKVKKYDTAFFPQHSFSAAHANERDTAHSHRHDIMQHTSPNNGRTRGHHRSRPKHTKTPNLDKLDRQRDLKPTEPNSYVIFSSSKPATTLGSQRIGGRNINSGMPTTLPGMRSVEYKALGQMSLIDGYQYRPILASMRSNSPPYQHPQTGTLSIVASTTDASRYYNRADAYHTSNIDCIKDEAIFCEPGSSLISSPKKTKYKGTFYNDSMSDIEGDSTGTPCCCPCPNAFRSRGRSASVGRIKEDLAERSKCQHCHEMFNHERNRPGACADAPDKCLNAINKVSCMFCVNSLFYHCCRDSEGDYDDEPCTCSNIRSGGRSKLIRRWSALAALSIIFPCLCLYPALRACHSCGIACHCCGGKHQAHFPSTDKQSQPKR